MTATDLHQALLVHTDAERAELAIECADRESGGLVLDGRQGLVAARYVMEHKGFTRPILLDASAYTGKNRKIANDPFDANWISQQRRLRLPVVLPDAGYVAQGNEAGLLTVLSRVHDDRPDMVAPLALHKSWLNAKEGLPTLRQHVSDAGVPIALILEDTGDPFKARYALQGLVEILQLGVKVYVLRCDVAAVGALAFGAETAAVGTRTALRHFYPQVENNGGGGVAQVAALVRGTLSYVSLDKIDKEVQKDPDNQLWWCDCVVCGGQNLSWIKGAPDPRVAAYLHSVEALYQIRADLFENNATPAQRRRAWIAQCDSAIFQHEDIVSGWEPQKVLGNWSSLRDIEPIT